MRTRRRFTDEFKREAIRLVGRPGVTVSSVARDLDINVSVLRRWVEKHNGGQWQVESGKPLKTDVVAELERVRRELAKVKMERDILKKALVTSRRTRREVRINRQAPYGVADAGDVSGHGSLAQRFLRMAGPCAQWPETGEAAADGPHSRKLRGERSHLWLAPRLA